MWLRVRGLPWRPAAAVIATVSMMLATVMGPHFAGMRAQAVEPVQTTTISHTKITGDGNYFTFADNAWDPGNDVHTWSKAPSDSLPAEGTSGIRSDSSAAQSTSMQARTGPWAR